MTEWYDIVTSDQQPDSRQGGVCICYKKSLPLKIRRMLRFSRINRK